MRYILVVLQEFLSRKIMEGCVRFVGQCEGEIETKWGISIVSCYKNKVYAASM